MHTVDVPFASLLLDAYNPRHRDVLSQAEAITAVQGRLPQKLLALAESICEDGLSPIDRVLVMPDKDSGRYIVLEGNRRIAALKVINNPQLCTEPRLRSQYKSLRESGRAPTVISCVVVESRAEARQWLLLKHGGELDGKGTVRWSTGMRQRFGAKPGTQEYRALAVLDWLERIADDVANSALLDQVNLVFEEKLTTFGRLVTDPDFRATVGFELDDRNVALKDALPIVIERLSDVMNDFDGGLSVTDLRSKEQRLEYVAELAARWGAPPPKCLSNGEPGEGHPPAGAQSPSSSGGGVSGDPGTRDAPGSAPAGGSPAPGGDNGTGQAAPTATPRPRNPRPRPSRLFYGLKISACKPRTRDVLSEAQRLDLSAFPNSAAVLTRALIDLVVGEAIAACQWNDNRELKERIITCLDKLDPSGRDDRFKGVRNHVRDRDSLLGANTMNAYLHNPAFHPTPTELRDTSNNYMPLLEALHAAILDSST